MKKKKVEEAVEEMKEEVVVDPVQVVKERDYGKLGGSEIRFLNIYEGNKNLGSARKRKLDLILAKL